VTAGRAIELEVRLHEPLALHERISLLNELSLLLAERDAARGATLAREAMELAHATGDVAAEAQALDGLARNLHAQGDHAAAFVAQDRALDLFRSCAETAHRRLEQASRDAERYRKLALEDALTGLANRRQLDQRLESLLRESRTRGTVLTVALADVDHFNGINDRFSQAVGDEVLRCVGEILRGHCRLGDIAGRLDAEQFMLIFRNQDMRAAAGSGERMRRAVEAWDWKSIHPQLRVTLSMGLASSTSLDHPEGLVDAADHWLHEAKRHGRNQVQPLTVTPA
jgi:two-component system, cell cycle response regulator